LHRGVTISLVIPCLNEEKGIAAVLERVPACVDEVVVADNGSIDKTAEVARAHGAVVAVEPRRGYGNAHMAGYRAASKDVIVTADGDGTYPLESITALVDCLLDDGVGFVSGSRFPLQNPAAMAFTNYVGNTAITWWMTILFKQKFCDGLSGMWCFKRAHFPEMHLVSKGWNFSEEIKLEAALHPRIGFRECPIPYHVRVGDTKLMPWRVGVENILFLFAKRFFMPKPGTSDMWGNPPA
jgi:dolichol-phosphate hexosyltransferase